MPADFVTDKNKRLPFIYQAKIVFTTLYQTLTDASKLNSIQSL